MIYVLNLLKRRNFYTFGLVCFLFYATHSLHGQNVNSSEIKTASSKDFEIGATNQKSLRVAISLTNLASDICRKYFPDFPDTFPQKITLLLDTQNTSSARSFDIKKEGGGFVRLRIYWNESLDLETTCLAVIDALIQRYLHYRSGIIDTNPRKAWPIEALSAELYLKLRPAKIEYYRSTIESKAAPNVDKFLANQDTNKENLPFAYIFLKALGNEDFNRQQIAFIITRAIYGKPLKNGLLKFIPKLDFNSAKPLENWWQLAQKSFVDTNRQSLQSIEASKQWLDEIINFDTIKNEKEESVQIKNLRDLWNLRSLPAVYDLVVERHDALIEGLLYVNPVYHNNARSLGLIFEAIIEKKREYEFTKYLVNYLNDRDTANNLLQLTQKTLRNK